MKDDRLYDPFIEGDESFVPEVYDPASVKPRLAKLVLIERLATAGLFEAALTAIKSDPLQYERWQASQTIDPQNPEVRGLLAAIGGDVDELLAQT